MKHSLWRALRPMNLLMVAITQGACQLWLGHFAGAGNWGVQLLPWRLFGLLLFSTVCITAAGYLINDYYDRAIDLRNKPQKALAAGDAKTILWGYALLNTAGFLLAIPPALAAGRGYLPGIQAATIGLLWLYSAYWKRLPLIGNVVVALLTAFSIWLLCFYNVLFTNLREDTAELRHGAFAFYVLSALAAFAFVLTWMREMVKDIEDLEGDSAEGCRTLPIVWGIRHTKTLTGFLAALVVTALSLMLYLSGKAIPMLSLVTGLLLLGLLVWTFFLFKARQKAGYNKLSNALKLLMLGGLALPWTVG